MRSRFSFLLVALLLKSCDALSVSTRFSEEPAQAVLNNQPSSPVRVPVVLGVMSQCPDALYCEGAFNKVIGLIGHSKLDLSLTFIGKLNATDVRYGVTCLHGPNECLGNIHELCTIAHTPKEPTSSQWWWPFLQCINSEGRWRVGADELSRHCAAEHGIDWEGSGIAECVAGDEGRQLLKESVLHTQALGIRNSCTVLINGRVRCIRDSEWKQCDEGYEPEDFVRTIDEEYEKLNAK